MYVLGIDAGGTHCRARLTDAAGQTIGTGLAGPANMNTGVFSVFAAIADAYDQAIESAGLDRQSIACIRAGIGVAGLERRGAKKALQAQAFPFRSVHITHDAFIANMGAHSGRDGGTVIVGTGSIAIGRVAGRDIRIGGYGFPVSDEGSAACIGLQAIRTTLQAGDGRVAHSPLTRALLQSFDHQTRCIVSWMDQASATDYGALAPQVMQAAQADDPYGRQIILKAAGDVALMIQGLVQSGVQRCALAGGLSGPMEPWLAPQIRAKLVRPEGDALDGALLLAVQKPSGAAC